MNEAIIAALIAGGISAVGFALVLLAKLASWKTAIEAQIKGIRAEHVKDIEALQGSKEDQEKDRRDLSKRIQDLQDKLSEQIVDLGKAQAQYLSAQTEQLNSLDREMVSRLSKLEARMEVMTDLRSVVREIARDRSEA